MEQTLKVEHSVVVAIAESDPADNLLETIVNAFPENVRDEIRAMYTEAVEEYENPSAADRHKENVPAIVDPVMGKGHQSDFIKPVDVNKLQLIQCPGCGSIHFRHAGYVLQAVPFTEKQEAKVAIDQVPVYICTTCKNSYASRDGSLHDVTPKIDLKAWDKTEKELVKTTGPGGQC